MGNQIFRSPKVNHPPLPPETPLASQTSIMIIMLSRVGCLFILGLALASAQVYPGGYPPGYPGGNPGGGYPPGGYPPGSYPPGTYPGGRGPGGSIPGGKGKTSKKPDGAQAALPSFSGKFKHMDSKSITIQMADERVLDFTRNSKTKFFQKKTEELKSPEFHEGDELTIEGSEDPHGYITAVNVYLDKAASAESTSSKEPGKDGVVDTWSDKNDKDKSDKTEKAAKEDSDEKAAAPHQASVERRTESAKADPDDPGPPKLRRGAPADPKREHAGLPAESSAPEPAAPPTLAEAPPAPKPVETASARPIPPARPNRDADEDTTPIVDRRKLDPMIRKAADAALDFTETLPSYVVQEMIGRYQSESNPPSWHPLDVVTTNLVYDQGKEDYRDFKINGKAVDKDKKIEDLGGAWSTGEFGTVLIDLFSPATAADFRYQRDSRASGVMAKLYTFEVDREHSHWSIHMASQTYSPAYRGSVWIDPETARVLRIEMQAYGFPEKFPSDHVESAVDYEYTRLGDLKKYLLPVHAETLMCQRGSSVCSRNAIDFRNYHKFTGESDITFGTPK
jgi:hypothetical protein